MEFDNIDKKLLNLLQWEFPLSREPYADLGRRLATDESQVIHRIARLKEQKVIRQISPVLDPRSLGYRTTLVAMRVTTSQLGDVEELIRRHPGVSHGYEREHSFNLWFTLAAPATVDMQAEVQRLASLAEPEAVLSLPAVRVFKIGAYFDIAGNGEASADRPASIHLKEVVFSPAERLIINELQQDLPLISTPFDAMATRLDLEVEEFLACCQSLLQRGIMRRFGAAINHNRAGFKANAMACWQAPPDKVAASGKKLASIQAVSHCYERKPSPLWQYNLFAVIHGHSREDCQTIADQVSRDTGLTNRILLFSTREFKKERVRYLV